MQISAAFQKQLNLKFNHDLGQIETNDDKKYWHLLQIPSGFGMLNKCQSLVTNEVKASQSMPNSCGNQNMSRKVQEKQIYDATTGRITISLQIPYIIQILKG